MKSFVKIILKRSSLILFGVTSLTLSSCAVPGVGFPHGGYGYRGYADHGFDPGPATGYSATRIFHDLDRDGPRGRGFVPSRIDSSRFVDTRLTPTPAPVSRFDSSRIPRLGADTRLELAPRLSPPTPTPRPVLDPARIARIPTDSIRLAPPPTGLHLLP